MGMIARPRATEDIDVLVLLGEDQKKRVSETIHRNKVYVCSLPDQYFRSFYNNPAVFILL